MKELKELKTISILYILLILLDVSYFSVFNAFLSNQIKLVQGESARFNIVAGVLCYVFIAIVLYYFILREKRSISDAFLLGVCIYAIYELTNKAILNKWSWQMVLLDSLWGGILFSIASAVMYKFIL